MSTPELFSRMAGQWKGVTKTWFKPDELADESETQGKMEIVMSNFVRHTYTGSMQGQPRAGEELIGFDEIISTYQVVWIDDFHMSKAIMISTGKAIENGFSVSGKYEIGGGHEPWGWRTAYELQGDSQLTITAFNIMPGAPEAMAVETVYQRI